MGLSRQKIPILDAFRFLASVLVVLVHYEVIFGEAIVYGTFATTAVSWFFIVSGFILSYTYPTLDTAQDYRRFYLHRIIRIYPVYLLAIVVSSLFVSINYLALGDEFFREVNRPLELIHDLPEQKEAGFFALATLRHLVFAQSVGGIETLKLVFNGPLWSIVLEIYFYLAFPLLLLIIKPVNTMTRIVSAFIIGYLLQLLLIQVNLPEAETYDVINLNVPVYTNPVIRGIEFLFGMLLYKAFVLSGPQEPVIKTNWIPTVLTLLLYIIVVIYVHQNIPYEYSSFFLVVPVVTIMIYALLRLQWHPTSSIVRYCTALGGVSYVLYSFHWPLMEIIQFYNLQPEVSSRFLQVCILMLMLLVVSYLIHHFVETPVRRLLYSKVDR